MRTIEPTSASQPAPRRSVSAHALRAGRRMQVTDLPILDTPARPEVADRHRSKSMSPRVNRFSDGETDEERPPVPRLPSGESTPRAVQSPIIQATMPMWETQASKWRERRQTMSESTVRNNSDEPRDLLRPAPGSQTYRTRTALPFYPSLFF